MFSERLNELHEERQRLVEQGRGQRTALAAQAKPLDRAWALVEEGFAWYRLARRSMRLLRSPIPMLVGAVLRERIAAQGARACTRAPSRSPAGG